MKRSAISMGVKRSTIFSEMMRRIRNTSNSLGWTEIARHLSKYMDSLRLSGYNELFRPMSCMVF